MTGVLGTVAAEQAAGAAETFAPDPEAYRARFPDSKELDDVVRSDWLFRMPSLHLAEAQRHGGTDCVFLNAAGHVTEASTSNVFALHRGRWLTPPLQGLAEESLLVYAVHVALLYGSHWTAGLGPTLGPQPPRVVLLWAVNGFAQSTGFD